MLITLSSRVLQTPLTAPGAAVAQKQAESLKDLSPQQWKSGIAAWLGWLFDGLDMHLYTLVAASFVATLVVSQPGTPEVKQYSGYIQAAFLLGWALGGGFFGRIGDKIGRSRALSLTILTYALFTGLSFFVTSWWQLLICRFIAALGIGGEWAVGASLLSETWPKKWRPWIAAVLQTGVNIGVLLACAAVAIIASTQLSPEWADRSVFLVGVLPALLVFWIRRNVPEPEEWHSAKTAAKGDEPGILDLFRGEVLRTTLLTVAICALALTGWWAFMFWHVQHLHSLPEVAFWTAGEKTKLKTLAFALVIGVSSIGNFVAAAVARKVGYRRAIALFCALFVCTIFVTYSREYSYRTLLYLLPLIGFCSGMFGLFTMYMPPLFPTLLRTTGAGFCYNIGRVAAAAGTIIFGAASNMIDLRLALLCVGAIFIPATIVACFLPELSPEEGGTN